MRNGAAKMLLGGKGADHTGTVVKSVLCGAYADDAQTMIVAIATPHCGLVQSWTAFVRRNGSWKAVWHHRGTAVESPRQRP